MGKFKLTFHAERCKGCGLCVAICPKKIVSMDHPVNSKGYAPAGVENEEACIGCASCAVMCPDGAIEIYQTEGGSAQ